MMESRIEGTARISVNAERWPYARIVDRQDPDGQEMIDLDAPEDEWRLYISAKTSGRSPEMHGHARESANATNSTFHWTARMRPTLLIALLTLSACATAEGNSAGGMVQNSWPDSRALALAEAHCSKYGKQAIVTAAPYPSVLFSCTNQ